MLEFTTCKIHIIQMNVDGTGYAINLLILKQI